MSLTEKGVELAGELLKNNKDKPDVRAAGGELAKAALTVTKFVNVALLPIAAVNFGYEKARAYFDTKFASDFADKVKDVPPESIVEPKVSVAGPTLQGLAFTHEELDLKNMYLNLLATAVDGRVASNAHPAYAEVIRQLTGREARFLQACVLARRKACMEIRLTSPDGWEILQSHVLGGVNGTTGEPGEIENEAAMVDNWVRLGLATVSYAERLADKNAYEGWDARPEVIRLRSRHEKDSDKVTCTLGVFERTSFGENFARAVGLLPPSAPTPEASKPLQT